MLYNDSVTLKGPNCKAVTGKDRVEVTRDNVWEIIGEKRFVGRCLDLSLCPKPLFSEEAIHLFNLYNMLGGISRLRTPEEYYDQSAKWIDACMIIDNEIGRIQREKQTAGTV